MQDYCFKNRKYLTWTIFKYYFYITFFCPFVQEPTYQISLSKLKWSDPDEEGLVKFLCSDKQFNEERVRSGAKKLHKARHTSTQGRLDSFFKVLPNSTPSPKRKVKIYLFEKFVGCEYKVFDHYYRWKKKNQLPKKRRRQATVNFEVKQSRVTSQTVFIIIL